MKQERLHVRPGHDGASRRDGDFYRLEPSELAFFREHGYLVVPDVVSESELAQIDATFTSFARGEVPNMGKDFCDMSGALARKPEEFSLVNAMLPRVYKPEFANNVYERRALSLARQLLGADVGLDYDQFLAKRPGQAGAVFAWHQDMAYWPKKSPDTRTATVSLALDDADLENGCLRVVPGSHSAGLRAHRPLAADLRRSGEVRGDTREDAHALVMDLAADDEVVYLPVKRGDVTIHNEWIVHGSGGNHSASRWRRTYVAAFRSTATIAWERKLGFTHSHNDVVNWDTFDRVETGEAG